MRIASSFFLRHATAFCSRHHSFIHSFFIHILVSFLGHRPRLSFSQVLEPSLGSCLPTRSPSPSPFPSPIWLSIINSLQNPSPPRSLQSPTTPLIQRRPSQSGSSPNVRIPSGCGVKLSFRLQISEPRPQPGPACPQPDSVCWRRHNTRAIRDKIYSQVRARLSIDLILTQVPRFLSARDWMHSLFSVGSLTDADAGCLETLPTVEPSSSLESRISKFRVNVSRTCLVRAVSFNTRRLSICCHTVLSSPIPQSLPIPHHTATGYTAPFTGPRTGGLSVSPHLGLAAPGALALAMRTRCGLTLTSESSIVNQPASPPRNHGLFTRQLPQIASRNLFLPTHVSENPIPLGLTSRVHMNSGSIQMQQLISEQSMSRQPEQFFHSFWRPKD